VNELVDEENTRRWPTTLALFIFEVLKHKYFHEDSPIDVFGRDDQLRLGQFSLMVVL
jgi:hypothetical protein